MFVGESSDGSEELPAEVVVAALPLDRFEDEPGDVVRVVGERPFDLRQRPGFGGLGLGEAVGFREPDVRVFDARPVELREVGDLDRFGVGERERVTGAPVESVPEVQDPAPLPAPAGGQVLPHLPVERGFQRVLHRHRAPGHEEDPRQLLGNAEPGEGVHEPGHLHRVEVRVRRVVDGDPGQPAAELRVGEPGVVVPDRVGRVVGEAVEEVPPGPGAAQVGAPAPVEVEDQVEPVGDEVAPEAVVDLGGGRRRDGNAGVGGSHRTGKLPAPTPASTPTDRLRRRCGEPGSSGCGMAGAPPRPRRRPPLASTPSGTPRRPAPRPGRTPRPARTGR